MRSTLRFAAASLALLALASAAPAHGVGADHGRPAPDAAPPAAGPRHWGELARAWEIDPWVVVPLALSAVLYAAGLWRTWAKAGRGHGIRTWEAACFAGGMLTLAVALVSPLHPWGNVLFSAHMVQHELLMLVAAPLLVLGKPVVAFLKALPSGPARRAADLAKARWWQGTWAVLSEPFAAWLIHAVVLWAWHVPALFQATLTSEFVHALQHVSFLASALLFWWAVRHDRARAAGYGAAVLYMFTTALHSGALGALLTFARSPWYLAYEGRTESWGLTPLEDQALGGLVMWVPACLVYIVAGLTLFAAWLSSSEDRVRRREAAARDALALSRSS